MFNLSANCFCILLLLPSYKSCFWRFVLINDSSKFNFEGSFLLNLMLVLNFYSFISKSSSFTFLILYSSECLPFYPNLMQHNHQILIPGSFLGMIFESTIKTLIIIIEMFINPKIIMLALPKKKLLQKLKNK